jgi:hypothetical protein
MGKVVLLESDLELKLDGDYKDQTPDDAEHVFYGFHIHHKPTGKNIGWAGGTYQKRFQRFNIGSVFLDPDADKVLGLGPKSTVALGAHGVRSLLRQLTQWSKSQGMPISQIASHSRISGVRSGKSHMGQIVRPLRVREAIEQACRGIEASTIVDWLVEVQ